MKRHFRIAINPNPNHHFSTIDWPEQGVELTFENELTGFDHDELRRVTGYAGGLLIAEDANQDFVAWWVLGGDRPRFDEVAIIMLPRGK